MRDWTLQVGVRIVMPLLLCDKQRIGEDVTTLSPYEPPTTPMLAYVPSPARCLLHGTTAYEGWMVLCWAC